MSLLLIDIPPYGVVYAHIRDGDGMFVAKWPDCVIQHVNFFEFKRLLRKKLDEDKKHSR